MLGKGGDYSGKALNALAGAAAAYCVRKVIALVWTKATGKQPPDKAEDPQVAIGEAVGWAVLTAAGVAAARVLAVRLVSRQVAGRVAESAD